MVMGAIAGAYLGYLVAGVTLPRYEASSQVFLEKLSPNVPLNSERTVHAADEVRLDLESQIVRLRSPRIIRQAIEKHRLTSLKSIGNHPALGALIADELRIKQPLTTRGILDIRYTGPDPEDARLVLKAVVETYGDMLRESHRLYHADTLRLLTDAKDEILKRLKEKEHEYQEFRKKAPPIWNGEDKANIHSQRLVEIEGVRSGLMIERSQLQSELQSLEQAVEAGVSSEALALIVYKDAERSSAKPGPTDPREQSRQLAQQLIPLLVTENQLVTAYGPDHPRVKEIRSSIALTRSILGKTAEDDVPPPRTDPIAVYLESLRQRIKATLRKETQLDQLYAVERDAAKQTLSLEYQDATLRDEITRIKQLFDAVVKRVGETDLSRNFGGYAMDVITEPSRGILVAPRPAIYLSAGALAGCLAGLALTFGREKLRVGFASVAEMERLLQTRVAGKLPVVSRPASTPRKLETVDAMVRMVHDPLSEFAEAIRGIRVALWVSDGSHANRVIQVTSPGHAQGCTTLAANLAAAIAASGKRVLLVDAHLDGPRLHTLFGLENATGMVSVLRGETDLATASQPSGVPLLDCLTTGPTPDNPGELVLSEQFEKLLNTARYAYDMVIVDSPPVPAVSDTRAIAARVDGVFLLLTLEGSSRDTTLQSVDLLRSVNASLLGVVVNRVSRSELLPPGS